MSKMAGLKRYALTPVIDFANHGGSESGEVAYNYFYDAFGAMAGRDFSPGSEVLISYGQRSNDHLLQYYGFVEKDNPHDVYELEDVVPKAIAHLTEAGSFDSSQATILEKSGLAKGGETLTYCKKGLQFPQSEAAMPALRLLALNESELGADKAAKIGIEDFKSQVSESNERAAWALAAAIAEQELAQAPSTPSQDAAILSGNVGKSLDAEKQLAIAFRIEKHKTLSAGVRALRAAAPGTGAGAAATAAPVSS
ncbi:hypothetical protein JKP88DRAFT_199774 [Tribonema minus]|uniref:Rubisco LSMT substrate-binding domain-containing protein n=1 Tax=Tribonema minus TaxID=303371 RepID=A0A835Z3R2_9STRA|nr:hypothetical protein JKP88DRAFT_199774 [Tribonema minus]